MLYPTHRRGLALGTARSTFFFLIEEGQSVGLEPGRLLALVSGRRGSPLNVSALFITFKRNTAESGGGQGVK